MNYSQSPPLAENEWLTAGARDPNMRPVKPSIHSPRSSILKHDQVASDRPSVGRRIFRTVARFFIAVLSYGDAAREVVIVRAPTLAWLLSLSTTKPPVVAATSADPMQQLAPLASNLDLVRRSVEQLAAKQDQLAQNIATLQGVQEDIRQKMSYTPPSPSQQAPSIPQPKPPQPKAQSSAVQSSPATRPPPPAGPLVLTR